MMSEEECLRIFEFHKCVQVDSGTFGLVVLVCTRCGHESFEEVQV